MKITKLLVHLGRNCEAVVMERHEAFGKTPKRCQSVATWSVETDWRAAKRVSSLNGSSVARFTKKHAACDAHAALAKSRVELLNQF